MSGSLTLTGTMVAYMARHLFLWIFFIHSRKPGTYVYCSHRPSPNLPTHVQFLGLNRDIGQDKYDIYWQYWTIFIGFKVTLKYKFSFPPRSKYLTHNNFRFNILLIIFKKKNIRISGLSPIKLEICIVLVPKAVVL